MPVDTLNRSKKVPVDTDTRAKTTTKRKRTKTLIGTHVKTSVDTLKRKRARTPADTHAKTSVDTPKRKGTRRPVETYPQGKALVDPKRKRTRTPVDTPRRKRTSTPVTKTADNADKLALTSIPQGKNTQVTAEEPLKTQSKIDTQRENTEVTVEDHPEETQLTTLVDGVGNTLKETHLSLAQMNTPQGKNTKAEAQSKIDTQRENTEEATVEDHPEETQLTPAVDGVQEKTTIENTLKETYFSLALVDPRTDTPQGKNTEEVTVEDHPKETQLTPPVDGGQEKATIENTLTLKETHLSLALIEPRMDTQRENTEEVTVEDLLLALVNTQLDNQGKG
eukprot:TRINITY_DN1510_c0_g1_i1.p1 TRINITY_DN1510_c0_g1~~TRINITY_DN1510_c0_g1_i1.p1  ORF type:complete len:336 (+),score=72.70 TRINITY_DN1510_c0_g1_i1:359-1366(+)